MFFEFSSRISQGKISVKFEVESLAPKQMPESKTTFFPAFRQWLI